MRAFLAASPDDGLRTQLEAFQARLKSAIARTRARITWTRPETTHLTFRFFADLDEALVAPMRAAVASIVSIAPPVRLPLAHLGAFPRPEAPRALWLGPPPEWDATSDGRRALRLESAIRKACAELGIAADDTPWRPHLTLARIKDGSREVGRAIRSAGLFDHEALAGSLVVDAVSLIRSDPGPTGYSHTTLWSEVLSPES